MADALVRRGLPFRVAHHVVGRLVADAERVGVDLAGLPDEAIAGALAAEGDVAGVVGADPKLPGDLRAAATLESALASCDVTGGTAPARVAAALAAARARLDAGASLAG